MHILVIFGAPWNKQSPWILSGTEVSGCKGKDILPFLASSDSQGPHDQIIEELNSHFSRWISDVASTGTPSTPGPGHAGLQFPHALPLNAASASRRGFPPCVTRSSLPFVHRQVLLWLFQDLVLWLFHTQQIEPFRPRRN